MRRIGFSTGALAKGDFEKGVDFQRGKSKAVELSALREDEVFPLISTLSSLKLDEFEYVSFHAPSHLKKWTESSLVSCLATLPEWVESIIVHPNIITTTSLWQNLGSRLVIENMDQRYSVGRTAAELSRYFDELPSARFCFDIGHARQIDPTMSIASELVRQFHDRIAEVHVSEVDADSHHGPISRAACAAFQFGLRHVPDEVPIIVESMIDAADIDEELRMVNYAFVSRFAQSTFDWIAMVEEDQVMVKDVFRCD